MIDALVLRASRTGTGDPQRVEISPVTIIVGPNNAGKSKLLSEICQYCLQGPNPERRILQTIEFESCSREEATRRIEALQLRNRDSSDDTDGDILIGRPGSTHWVRREAAIHWAANPNAQKQNSRNVYIASQFLNLDGAGRLGLVTPQPAGDLKLPPQTPLAKLFVDDERRATFRRILYDAIGHYAAIDPTAIGNLSLKLAREAPTAALERSLSDEAINYFSRATPIDAMSDGIKAFAGVMLQLIAGSPSIFVIDEPEAFLHPALVQRLAHHIANVTRDKRVFVATHSADFLLGCIQAGVAVTVVRLTFKHDVATARVLPSSELIPLLRNPLLRSAGVLAGVFYEGVVVTEADTDRAFYQEINDRLRQSVDQGAIPNCLFVNAQNKQTLHAIARPLRNLGIPAAMIADIDVLKDGGTNWRHLLEAATIPDIERGSLSQARAAIDQRFTALGVDMKKGGLTLLTPSDREAATNMLARLAEYGLFIVPLGEVESWLQALGVNAAKDRWLVRIFERMGADASQGDYVQPEDNDVWEFMRGIKDWIVNPARKGMPA